jgi:CHAD domain-containing protein
MLRAFASILRAPRRYAAKAKDDPVEAVHEYRKSIRRARALASLLRPAIGKTAHRGLAEGLKAAFRETSSLRDADVLLETLEGLPPDEAIAAERETVGKLLEEEIAAAKDTAATEEILQRGLPHLKSLPAALEVILPADYSIRELGRGLERSARRVAEDLDTARTSGDETDFHEWRKSVKELRYQVELLAYGGSRAIKAREKTLGELAKELGHVTDLAVLRRELSSRQGNGRMPATPALLGTLEARAAESRGTLLERGATLFGEKPAPWARRVLAERG